MDLTNANPQDIMKLHNRVTIVGHAPLIIFTILHLFSQFACGQPTCAQIQARIDGYRNLDVFKEKSGFDSNANLTVLYDCLTGTQRLPTTLITTDRNFILGDGWGTDIPYFNIPFQDWITPFLFNRVWKGKVLKKESNGKVSVKNIITITRRMMFYGDVYNTPSLSNGGDCVVIDYRPDKSVPISSQFSVVKKRDELREITYRGEKSQIYLGRLYDFKGDFSELNTTAWTDRNKWNNGTFFFTLDFRPSKQSLMPRWVRRIYEKN